MFIVAIKKAFIFIILCVLICSHDLGKKVWASDGSNHNTGIGLTEWFQVQFYFRAQRQPQTRSVS